MSQTTTVQDAIRLLYILVRGSDRISNHPDGYVGFFDGKAKLHALDFWVRYPDFLAYELLNKYEETGEDKYLLKAENIIDDQEPDLRSIPMIRYRFGAFENLHESLSLLVSKGLVYQDGDKSDETIKAYYYYITPLSVQLVDDVTKEFPSLGWYDERAKLVKEIAGSLGGSALKERQYKHMSYATTQLGTQIPSIKNEVINRLNALNRIK
ncbi:hypothetical protein [Mucilaginibacter aquatilis]|uniref:Uncharacterized protein n=1 Tax=Mucilaginibacter aquatilis TaxID=1517760 RepID=A0A6I4I627_9SPHI|nr:hypothetical protein [Mucilaginibacter aquatilis]MVN90531.1 hypothetical protein [Mucilaginibacter aquatilis]